MRNGIQPKQENDLWKARILVGMNDSLDEIEQELRKAWAEVSSILDEEK